MEQSIYKIKIHGGPRQLGLFSFLVVWNHFVGLYSKGKNWNHFLCLSEFSCAVVLCFPSWTLFCPDQYSLTGSFMVIRYYYTY